MKAQELGKIIGSGRWEARRKQKQDTDRKKAQEFQEKWVVGGIIC